MTFRVVENSVRAKGRRHPSEDVVHIGKRFVAVIDGATAKEDVDQGEETPGRALAAFLASCLEGIPAMATGAEAVRFLSGETRRWLRGQGDRWREAPSASLVAYSGERSEIWSLGDCSFMVGARIYDGAKELDRIAAAFRAAVLEACDLTGEQPGDGVADVGRAAILPLLARQHAYRNAVGHAPYGYGAIDGREEAVSFLRVVPVPPGAMVVLASDGYPLVKPTLEESEAYLDFVLAADPYMVRLHPGTKGVAPGDGSHDDRAYVRLLVDGGGVIRP